MDKSSNIENISTNLEFIEVPEFLNVSNQSLNYSSENTNENINSEIILCPKKKFIIKKCFRMKLNIPDIIDWRMNLLDINTEEKYIVIGIDKKVALIPIHFIKNNSKEKFGKIKFILESADLINQIKIMKGDKLTNNYYILAVDNKGILHSKSIKYDHTKDTVNESDYKKFDCKVDAPDSSLWSIDCFYPYVVVGGNHRCVLLNYIHDDHIEEENGIKNNNLLIGNKHNIPCVSFSQDGRFIACTSIDTEVKIWETLTGKLIKKVSNKTKQWGWATKFVESKLFHITSDSHNSYNDNNNTNNYQNHNNLIRNFINNLVGEQNTVVFQQEEIGTEFLKDNCIFTKDFLTNDENDNELLEDKIDNDYICQESLNKQSLKDHLLKYYIFCCHQHCLFLNSLYFKNDDDSLSELCLGKINLIDNYFKCKYNNSQNLIYSTAMNMKYYYEYSRYEFIYVSYCLHVLIVGNRQGDIQIYDLELILSNEGELKINNNPLGIIDCNGRIVGFQVVEYNNKHSNNYLEIYVLKLNKILECYKFRRSFC